MMAGFVINCVGWSLAAFWCVCYILQSARTVEAQKETRRAILSWQSLMAEQEELLDLLRQHQLYFPSAVDYVKLTKQQH